MRKSVYLARNLEESLNQHFNVCICREELMIKTGKDLLSKKKMENVCCVRSKVVLVKFHSYKCYRTFNKALKENIPKQYFQEKFE